MSTIAIFDEDIFDEDIFDTRIKKHFVTINDEGGNVSDLVETQSKFQRNLIEGQPSMFDDNIFDQLIFDTVGGGGSITDSIIASISNNVPIIEAAIVISDLLERVLNAKVTFIENVTSNDGLTRLVKYFRSLNESGGGMFDGGIFDNLIFDIQFGTIQVTDSLVAIGGKVRSFTENVPVTDDLQRMLKAFVVLVETTIISELIVAKKTATRLLSENVPSTDDLQRMLKAFRTFADTTTISELIASVRGAKITFLETTIISELLERLSKHFRSFTESNAISDILAAFKVVGRRIKRARAWINKRTTKAFIFKRKTTAYANKRKTTARV